MFFRRVFSRKDTNTTNTTIGTATSSSSSSTVDQSLIIPQSPHRNRLQNRLHQRQSSTSTTDDKRGLTIIQLTPLWEHIIRTKSLPIDINETEMFSEFIERLKDPEWQVRQHALRVLLDVLIVMKDTADRYFSPLIKYLVENLGHAAPAIRKGSLDVLKVYMSETAMPETILLEIIDIGMEQKLVDSSTGSLSSAVHSRLCVGVMLSLPSLIQTTINSPKQNYILKAVIESLTNKMIQVTYQEVALKVLIRIRELVGAREFSEHIGHGAYREFELLCNVYGLPRRSENNIVTDASNDLYISSSAGGNRTWQVLGHEKLLNSAKVRPTELNWKSMSDEDEDENGVSNKTSVEQINKEKSLQINKKDEEKVILETEINIDNTAVTMRILEQSDDISDGDVDDDDIDVHSIYEHSGIVRVLTDSELEEINTNNLLNSSNNSNNSDTVEFLRRTPRRVTFGGEIVKMRTPDSDSVNQSDIDDYLGANLNINSLSVPSASSIATPPPPPPPLLPQPAVATSATTVMPSTLSDAKTSAIVTILNDQKTLPVNIDQINKTNNYQDNPASSGATNKDSENISPILQNRKLSSRRNSLRRLSTNPVENLITSTPSHKQIEVLHNLQRSPLLSPTRNSRRNSIVLGVNDKENQVAKDLIGGGDGNNNNDIENSGKQNIEVNESNNLNTNEQNMSVVDLTTETTSKTWEDLQLVDDNCIKDLKTGDWRAKSNALCTIENVLKSSEKLLILQPHMESFLKMILSSEKYSEVIEDKRRILINLITRLPLDNLEKRALQITVGLCRQGGAASNRIAKVLMQRLLPTAVVHRLLSDEFLKTRSSRFRENALQMVLYALMTFPSTYFDISICVGRATNLALDRKKRVRQAALDVLAVLGQISSMKIVLDVVQQISKNRDDYSIFVAAVKARLSRKQLPIVSVDGNVQYALRIPSSTTSSSSTTTTTTANSGLGITKYLFGADIDWVRAGSGSVSPTSIKKRKYQLNANYYQNDMIVSEEIIANKRNVENAKRNKAPHEILAVGVGVKPAYENNTHNNNNNTIITSSSTPSTTNNTTHHNSKGMPAADIVSGGTINGFVSKGLPYFNNNKNNTNTNNNNNNTNNDVIKGTIQQDNDKNTHFVIATSIPSQLPQHIINNLDDSGGGIQINGIGFGNTIGSGAGIIKQMKIQSRSFPDLLDTNKTQHHQHQHQNQQHQHQPPQFTPHNGRIKPSRLPVTSRFPAMEIYSDGNKTSDNSLNSQRAYYQNNSKNNNNNQTSNSTNNNILNNINNNKNNTTNNNTNTSNKNINNNNNNNNNNSTIKKQKSINLYQNKLLNSSLPKNLNTTHIPLRHGYANYSQESLTSQSSIDEYRPVTHPTIENITHRQKYKTNQPRRFINVDKYLINSKTQKSEQHLQKHHPVDDNEDATNGDHIDNNNHRINSSSNPSSAIYRNIDNVSRQSFYENNKLNLENSDESGTGIEDGNHVNTTTTSEYSTEDQSTSGRSTPTRRLVDSLPTSRPLSVISTIEKSKNTIDEIDRPKTATSFRRSNTSLSIHSNHSHKSSFTKLSVENLQQNYDHNSLSSRRQSIGSNVTQAVATELEGFNYDDGEENDNEKSSSDAEVDDEQDESGVDHVEQDEEEVENEDPPIIAVERPKSVFSLKLPSSNGDITDEDNYDDKNDNRPLTSSQSTPIKQINDNDEDEANNNVDDSNEINVVNSATTKKQHQRRIPLTYLRRRQNSPSKNNNNATAVAVVVKSAHGSYLSKKHYQNQQQQVQELFPQTLGGFERPREALNNCLHQLDSSNWEETILGIQNFVRLMRHHPEYIEPQIHLFCTALCKHIRNLRSQVSRASCTAATEFFQTKSKLLETETDELAQSLFTRTADTNKFLRSDASIALEAMCDHIPAQKVIPILLHRGATHQNAIVRAASAKMFCRIVKRIGCEKVFSLNRDLRDRLIVTGANLLQEGSLETRNHAKEMFKHLSDHPNYDKILFDVIPSRSYRNIEKTLRTIKY